MIPFPSKRSPISETRRFSKAGAKERGRLSPLG